MVHYHIELCVYCVCKVMLTVVTGGLGMVITDI